MVGFIRRSTYLNPDGTVPSVLGLFIKQQRWARPYVPNIADRSARRPLSFSYAYSRYSKCQSNPWDLGHGGVTHHYLHLRESAWLRYFAR
jgi:hypothetical protein